MLGKGLTSFFCMWMSSFICTVCWKGCHFPTLNDLGSLVKIIWPYVWVFISGLSILFHWCIYLSYPTSHWFCYCSFVILIGLKSGSEDTPVLFIFKFVLAVHGPLRFHKNLRCVPLRKNFNQKTSWYFKITFQKDLSLKKKTQDFLICNQLKTLLQIQWLLNIWYTRFWESNAKKPTI